MSPESCNQLLFMELNHSALSHVMSFGVDPDHVDARPAPWVAFAGLQVKHLSALEDLAVSPVVSLRRTHLSDDTVMIFAVVPVHEGTRPPSRSVEVGEPLGWELRSVLRVAEQTLDERVVVANSALGKQELAL